MSVEPSPRTTDDRPAAKLTADAAAQPGAPTTGAQTAAGPAPSGATGGAPSGASVELGVAIVVLLAVLLVWVRARFVAGGSTAAVADRQRGRAARPRPVDAWAESGRRLRVPPEAGEGGHESRGGL